MKSLYWARTDLRIHDNHALAHHRRLDPQGAVVWTESPSTLRASAFRRRFLLESLGEFKQKVEALGMPFVHFQGTIQEYLATLQDQVPGTVVFTHDYTPEEIHEQNAVSDWARARKADVAAFHQSTLLHPEDLPFAVANMPFIFTQFRKQVEEKLQVRPCLSLTELPVGNWPEKRSFPGGEDAALARLRHYLSATHAVKSYKETRNGLLDFDDSTKFSPWLSLGCLSPRRIFEDLKAYEQKHGANESTYWVLFELLWRDYFKFFAWKYKQRLFSLKGVHGDDFRLPGFDQRAFESWKSAATQDDFVNANMRELNATGWMSNRGRQNVASYLIHDLGVPWTLGADYFERTLLDYDAASNWGNWLYLSGQGSDPRARKFNTQKQAHDYDPSGEYRRRWAKS